MGSSMSASDNALSNPEYESPSSLSSSATSSSLQSSSFSTKTQSIPTSNKVSKAVLPNPSLITPGSVFVFDEEESGICRWTDGRIWSPSRICGNFLVYRELFRKLSNEKCRNNNDKAKMKDGSGIKDKALKEKVEKENLVVLGCMKGTFVLKKDGLIKKTICVKGVNVLSPQELRDRNSRGGRERGGRRASSSQPPTFKIGGIQHLVCYEKPGEMEGLHRPQEYVELLELPLSKTFITKQKYRNPIRVLPLPPGEQPIDPYDEYIDNKRIVESRPLVKETGTEKSIQPKARAPRTSKRKATTIGSSTKKARSRNTRIAGKDVVKEGDEDDNVKFETSECTSDSEESYHRDETPSGSELDGCGMFSLRNSKTTNTANHSYPTRGQSQHQQREQRHWNRQQRQYQGASYSSSRHARFSVSDNQVSPSNTSTMEFVTSNNIKHDQDDLRFHNSIIDENPMASGEGDRVSICSPSDRCDRVSQFQGDSGSHLAVHGFKINGEWRICPPSHVLERSIGYSEYYTPHHYENASWQEHGSQGDWKRLIPNSRDDSAQGIQHGDKRHSVAGWQFEGNSENFKMLREGNINDPQSDYGHHLLDLKSSGRMKSTEVKREPNSPRASLVTKPCSISSASSVIEDWSSGSLSSGRSLSSSPSLSPETTAQLAHISPANDLVSTQNTPESFTLRKSRDHIAETEYESDYGSESSTLDPNSLNLHSESATPNSSPTEDSPSQKALSSQLHSYLPVHIPKPSLPESLHLQYTLPVSERGINSPVKTEPYPELAMTNFGTHDLLEASPRDVYYENSEFRSFMDTPSRLGNQQCHEAYKPAGINESYFGAHIPTFDSEGFSDPQRSFFVHQNMQSTSSSSIAPGFSMHNTPKGGESQAIERFSPHFPDFQTQGQGTLSSLCPSSTAMPRASTTGSSLQEFGPDMQLLGGSSRKEEPINMDDPYPQADYMEELHCGSRGMTFRNECLDSIYQTLRTDESMTGTDGELLQLTKRRRNFGGFDQHELHDGYTMQSTSSCPQSMETLFNEAWPIASAETRSIPTIAGTPDPCAGSFLISPVDGGAYSNPFAPVSNQAHIDSLAPISKPHEELRPKYQFKLPLSYLFPEGSPASRTNEHILQTLSATSLLETQSLPIKSETISDNAVTAIWEGHLDTPTLDSQYVVASQELLPGDSHASPSSLYFSASSGNSSNSTAIRPHEAMNDRSYKEGLRGSSRDGDLASKDIKVNSEYETYPTAQILRRQYGKMDTSDMTRSHIAYSETFSSIHQDPTGAIESYDESCPDSGGISSCSNTSISLGKEEYLLHTQRSDLSTLSLQLRYEDDHLVSQSTLGGGEGGSQQAAVDLPSAICRRQLNTSQEVLTCLSELDSRSRMFYEPSSSDTQQFSDLSGHDVFEDEKEQEQRQGEAQLGGNGNVSEVETDGDQEEKE
ncbi:hypothetical protein BGZ46_007518 [Entomortierella lignicola]|nr:hypothetical protein BGZ46_007518 [Entomortierella lignicola]